MFVVKPEIGEKAWMISMPHIIKNEIFIVNVAGIIEEIDYSGIEALYFINNYYVPMYRIPYFTFGGITMQNDRFTEHKCMMEDDKRIKYYCSKAGKILNVNRVVEQSWWVGT